MHYPLVAQVARKIRQEPDLQFQRLSGIGSQATARGYFTKAEFLEICRWKSARRIALCQSNSDQDVAKYTAQAIAATDDSERIRALLKLTGVAVPTASALLAAYAPDLFGVIDVRGWQFLHSVGAVSRNRKGLNLSVRNWLQYLRVLRCVAHQVGTTPRLVDISLYWEHKAGQKRALYSTQAPNFSFKLACGPTAAVQDVRPSRSNHSHIGEEMSIPATGWQNKVGTADRGCKCGTWKAHWVKFAKKSWPDICSVKDCSTASTLGAHVVNSIVPGERIVPMCESCNKLSGPFTLKGSISVPSANRSVTCERGMT